jgi:hypothetical protein
VARQFGNKKLDNRSNGSNEPASNDRAADEGDKVNGERDKAKEVAPAQSEGNSSSSTSLSSESSVAPSISPSEVSFDVPGKLVSGIGNQDADVDAVMVEMLNVAFNNASGSTQGSA